MENENKLSELKKLMTTHISRYTIEPTLKSVDENIFVSYRLGNILSELILSQRLIGRKCYKPSRAQFLKHGINKQEIVNKLETLIKNKSISEEDIRYLEKITAITCSKSCALPFVVNQINWISISIMSASYLNSIIIMRSTFELLINIVTPKKGSMHDRIYGIEFFNQREKHKIKILWDELCSWGHPYEKWLKNMCSVFISYGPIYHKEHFENCMKFLEGIFDIYLVICKEHFGMDVNRLGNSKKKRDFSKFKMFQKRLRYQQKLDRTKKK